MALFKNFTANLNRAALIVALLGALVSATVASPLRHTAFVEAVAAAKSAIVNINGNKTVAANDAPGSVPGDQETQRVNGMGTGVIIDPRGYIVTNFHVVEGVQQIRVNLHDERMFVAKVIANDPATDLALIKISAPEPLPTIPLGTSRDLMLCEEVVAVGNAFGYSHTVTRGVISALHRSVQVSDSQYYHDLIQTDASINPGNSGGPLINVDGKMIAINAAVRMGAQGIGFAIPVDKVMEVTSRMIRSHVNSGVEHGVLLDPLPSAPGSGIRTRSVKSLSPGEQAGIKPGDQIVTVDNRPVAHRVDLDLALLERRVGDAVPVVVQRGEEKINLQLVLNRSADTKATPVEDEIWRVLGLRLEKVEDAEFRQLKSQFTGGLRVVEVRPQSPAWKYHLREGDVLVGLIERETLNINHVAFLINEARSSRLASLTFFIVRDGEPYSGKMDVAWSSTRNTLVR